MNFLSTVKINLKYALEFLEKYESSCVELISFVRKEDSNIYVFSEKPQINSKLDIKGVCYIKGSFLHCFPFFQDYETEEFQQDFLDFIADKKLKSIIGERQETQFFLRILAKKHVFPYQVNVYKLMLLEGNVNKAPVTLKSNEIVCRVQEKDLEKLVEIQKHYLMEEVVPVGKKLQDIEVKLNLKQILKNQLVYVLVVNEQIAAKANTNAIGINWIQLGGVYTDSSFRKKYYAWNVLIELINKITSRQKNVCLFVKDQNTAACSLYEKMGFKYKLDFEIAYF